MEYRENNFFMYLERLTTDCKDNQEEFVCLDRIRIMEYVLSYSLDFKLVYGGKLCRIYSCQEDLSGKQVVLVSSHIDCVFQSLFVTETEECFLGTFDNSITNACLVYMIMFGLIPENVVIAFTGSEEEGEYLGAQEAVHWLMGQGSIICGAVALDVTNEGFSQQASFTLENDMGIDLFTAHRLIERLSDFKEHYLLVHDSLPDETWLYYPQYQIPTLSFCLPVQGDMHSEEGVEARRSSIPYYIEGLFTLLSSLCDDLIEKK